MGYRLQYLPGAAVLCHHECGFCRRPPSILLLFLCGSRLGSLSRSVYGLVEYPTSMEICASLSCETDTGYATWIWLHPFCILFHILRAVISLLLCIYRNDIRLTVLQRPFPVLSLNSDVLSTHKMYFVESLASRSFRQSYLTAETPHVSIGFLSTAISAFCFYPCQCFAELTWKC